jgi:hypothetical protein
MIGVETACCYDPEFDESGGIVTQFHGDVTV